MVNEKRLIDANALLAKMRRTNRYFTIKFDIEEAPTVDAVEVVYGEWEKYTDDKFMGYGTDGRIRYRKVYSYKCSKCWNYTAVKHKYCPNCGAKMDGDGNG